MGGGIVEIKTPPIRAGWAVQPAAFEKIRRRLLLEGCKWDPQVGDTQTLAPFPLILSRATWDELQTGTSTLAREILEVEREVLARPELLDRLGMSRGVRNVLLGREEISPNSARVMRFDFHYTRAGWAVSEVNNDVPGGYSEAGCLSELVAEQFPDLKRCGDPGKGLAETMLERAEDGCVVLFSAPGYMEDHQVISFLGERFRELGATVRLVTPQQLEWRGTELKLKGESMRVGCGVRFFQAEWLPHLRGIEWRKFFRGAETPLTNPGMAIIGESKRLPLIWDRLKTPVPAWRKYLPETRDPTEVPWQKDESWILKTPYCNNGDTVSHPGTMPAREWRRVSWSARLFPGQWLAQRRFEPEWLETPIGRVQVCIGVYAIDGEPVGAYGRVTSKGVVDFAAVDAAVLVEEDDDEARGF